MTTRLRSSQTVRSRLAMAVASTRLPRSSGCYSTTARWPLISTARPARPIGFTKRLSTALRTPQGLATGSTIWTTARSISTPLPACLRRPPNSSGFMAMPTAFQTRPLSTFSTRMRLGAVPIQVALPSGWISSKAARSTAATRWHSFRRAPRTSPRCCQPQLKACGMWDA